ncbi:thermonuclease family protein [Mycoplasmatota bacterium WC44]
MNRLLTPEHIIFIYGMFFGISLILILTVILKSLLNKEKDYEKVKVTTHVDGDTIGVRDRKKITYKVRLLGVNTPETKHPTKGQEFYGKEASEFTEKKLLNKKVYLEKDSTNLDMYGRALRYVWLKKPKKSISERILKRKMFNAILISKGYASELSYKSNAKYVDLLKKFEQEAKEKQRGMWQKR